MTPRAVAARRGEYVGLSSDQWDSHRSHLARLDGLYDFYGLWMFFHHLCSDDVTPAPAQPYWHYGPLDPLSCLDICENLDRIGLSREACRIDGRWD